MPDFKKAIIYQIYPRSFNDSDGDGVGDLPGIIQKLDYLHDLGVDVLWLSPIFQSPNADNGYDISDYRAIQPTFGTMDDFDELLAGVHKRGMKLILDLVVNHSSDEHRWFQESRKSKDNPYRDYYIWRAPKDGKEPNNWLSFFSGPAWKVDEQTGEYYLHLFAEKQPDLNWENPKLRQEIYQMMRFWLDKGVDGFRMDVIPFLSKDTTFPDYPEGRYGDLTIYANGPRIHEFLQEMNREVLSHYECMTVGEGFGVSAEQANLYVGKDRRELNMIYHFDHAVPREEHRFIDPAPEFTLPELKAIFHKWDETMGDTGWQNIYFGNHDNPRVLSRFGDAERYLYESTTMLATVLLTQRGTPSIYQGDEIGMTNCPFNSIDEYDDIQVKNAWQALVVDGGQSAEVFLQTANRIARDHARTPMQWHDGPNAGFMPDGGQRDGQIHGEPTVGGQTFRQTSEGPVGLTERLTGSRQTESRLTEVSPWLKINPNYPQINVADQQVRADSVLSYYKKLIRWRKQTPAIWEGMYRDLLPEHPAVWAYERIANDERLVILANFSDQDVYVPEVETGEVVLSNYTTSSFALRPFEARILAPYA
ncbi:alpha amylase catalytic region [Fibrisoma limi BUZ 3]|uniref:Alpha amylase catalytic region n=1 Tax=Fibrisoma limi BUZ 3 TaxID=1185876 RepID=I2GN87_9BACT|nr:alpha-glucosidase [Fibrisoma limi]CCH55365.1 alpha amylase catalytic region [Fibrisoma limi BUZ 3]